MERLTDTNTNTERYHVRTDIKGQTMNVSIPKNQFKIPRIDNLFPELLFQLIMVNKSLRIPKYIIQENKT